MASSGRKQAKIKIKIPREIRSQPDSDEYCEGANATLDSNSDEFVMGNEVRRQSARLNSNVTDQAMASIITEDDANPLSENGDGGES